MKNEKGYTLLTVLMMMVLMVTFGLVLASGTLNTAKQNNLTEKEVQLTDLAEMGVIHYQQKVKAILKDIQPDDPAALPEGTKPELISEKLLREGPDFNKNYDLIVKSSESGEPLKKFMIDSIKINQSDTKTITIGFQSTGCFDNCSNSTNIYTVDGELKFNWAGGGPGNFTIPVTEQIDCKTLMKDNNFQVKQNCTIYSNLENFVEDRHKDSIKVHDVRVHITGDADLKNLDFSNGGTVCVYGTLSDKYNSNVQGAEKKATIYTYNADQTINVDTLDSTIIVGETETNNACMQKSASSSEGVWDIDKRLVEYQ